MTSHITFHEKYLKIENITLTLTINKKIQFVIKLTSLFQRSSFSLPSTCTELVATFIFRLLARELLLSPLPATLIQSFSTKLTRFDGDDDSEKKSRRKTLRHIRLKTTILYMKL